MEANPNKINIKRYLDNFENDKSKFKEMKDKFAAEAKSRERIKSEREVSFSVSMQDKQARLKAKQEEIKNAKRQEILKLRENLKSRTQRKEDTLRQIEEVRKQEYAYRKMERAFEKKQEEFSMQLKMLQIQNGIEHKNKMKPIDFEEINQHKERFENLRSELQLASEVNRLAKKPLEKVLVFHGPKHSEHLENYREMKNQRKIRREKLRMAKEKRVNFSQIVSKHMIPKLDEEKRRVREERIEQIKSGKVKRGRFNRSVELTLPKVKKMKNPTIIPTKHYKTIDKRVPLEKPINYLEDLKMSGIGKKSYLVDLKRRSDSAEGIRAAIAANNRKIDQKKKFWEDWNQRNVVVGVELGEMMMEAVQSKMSLLEQLEPQQTYSDY